MADMDTCVLKVDDTIFCPEAILKASYMFIDDFFITPKHVDAHTIAITIEPKANSDMTDIDKRFGNELIAQMVRYNLSQSNKTMKELILGRALYSTCLDTAEPAEFQDGATKTDYSLDDIAVDWFEVNKS